MYRITNILQTPQRKKLLDLAFFMIAAPQNGYALTEICNFAAEMSTWRKEIVRFFVRLRRIRHRNGYGVHSPFAYGFIKGVVYEHARYYAYKNLKKRRRKRRHGERGLSARADKLMFRIANYCHPAQASLIGIRSALTAEYVAAGSSKAAISIYPVADSLPARAHEFVYTAPGTDFLTAFHITAQSCNDNTFFAAAGIHSSRRAQSNWKEICADPKAIVTFDLHEIGLVFFNKNLNKQNYTVSF